jgi:acetyl esterase/lipase
MASTGSALLHDLYTNWGERFAANPAMDLDSLRDLYTSWATVTAEPVGVTYESLHIAGMPALWARPVDAPDDRALLFIHGGGYLGGSTASHRKLAGHFAKAARAPALLVDYRLAPENPFPEAQFADCRAAFDWLMDSGIEPGRIALIGDSAGGALVTLLALQLRDAGADLPAAVVPLSPMLDLGATGETFDTNAEVDLLASREKTIGAGQMLLGPDGDPADPSVNPLTAELSGLPPFYLSAGGHEALLDDSRRLAAALTAAGVEAHLEEGPEMQHVFHFLAGNAPEADESIAAIGAFLREKLDSASAARVG